MAKKQREVTRYVAYSAMGLEADILAKTAADAKFAVILKWAGAMTGDLAVDWKAMQRRSSGWRVLKVRIPVPPRARKSKY